jgi:hypothetical protein
VVAIELLFVVQMRGYAKAGAGHRVLLALLVRPQGDTDELIVAGGVTEALR